jgi:hypothetical protein
VIRAFFNIQMPPRKSPFFLNLYKQVSEEKEIDKRKVSLTLYPLSFRFNKIDLNCYVFLPLTNDKQFIFVQFFPSFILNTSIVCIHFRANLDAQNAGNGISGFQISIIFW